MSFLLSCLPCFNSTPELKINKVKFKILKLLGEGGFSYVYLVQASNGATYALKKIRCPFGAESVKLALREVENYKEFHSPYIIRAIDSSIVQEEDGSKTVYILLPNFDGGSLQDIINKNVLNGENIDEDDAIRLFVGVCRGLQSMHRHHLNNNSNSNLHSNQIPELIGSGNLLNSSIENDENDNLLNSNGTESEVDTLNDSINDSINDPIILDDVIQSGTEMTDTIAFAHKDIKPANIMLSRDGIPVLCDLGSCGKARIKAKTRIEAISIQELAAEHSTLSYRAPELLDVKTGSQIDEKIDIWSLGCTLYALLFGCSPFEFEENEHGGSMTLAISTGKYSFPNDKVNLYSDEIKDLVKFCLIVDPKERPTIEKVLSRAVSVQSGR
ncbi:hypothetical protein WICMUC_003027 [Wickerhamomyces mucosus]|uniref:non-specific serine/threonine protein kinase n=1 Tax=Wickerhamomyces mucosus TaxID=1378264 RepID=A0A9P8TDK6_9ASCO|nr:hypothetical protein WICMUC_003027 [Wickerhamomyces mucosus]